MKRFAFGAAALIFSSVIAIGSAHADRGMHGFHGGFHGGFHDRDRGFHHHFFFHHGFFRPFFFFGTPFFAPVPIAVYPPLPYPAYAYEQAPGAGSCYQYQTTIIIDGQPTPAWGTACLQPDGTWRTVD
jgi:hypothetical protein